MDILDLETVAAVARCGGVTAAARELHTVQSNVTARIQALEGRLGVALFERHSRGMRLTRAGQRLLPYARRLSALVAEAEDAVRGGPGSGPLAIGSLETTAAVRLPAVLLAFRRANPGVQLTIETGSTAALVDAVLAHRLDGAFVAGPIDDPRLASHTAFTETLVLVSPADWKTTQSVAKQLRQGAAALMFRQGCSYRQRFEELLHRRGWPAAAHLEFGTLDGILGCVAAGLGAALLPRAVVENTANAAALRCHRLDDGDARVRTLFVHRHDEAPSGALRRFVACAKGV